MAALHPLIEPDDSLLVVIDVQDAFLVKLPDAERHALAGRIGWLVALAGWLRIPLVVTDERMGALGGTTAAVAALLPAGTPTHDKPIFGLVATPAIMDAVVATGRRTAVLVGLETDVCVAQSGLGLLARGYRVVVVADAIGSPGPAHAAGIARLRDAGQRWSAPRGSTTSGCGRWRGPSASVPSGVGRSARRVAGEVMPPPSPCHGRCSLTGESAILPSLRTGLRRLGNDFSLCQRRE